MDLIQVYVKYDLYEELELTNVATKDDIKKKYKKLPHLNIQDYIHLISHQILKSKVK